MSTSTSTPDAANPDTYIDTTEFDDFEARAMEEVLSRITNARPDTPEPSSRQGRRNVTSGTGTGTEIQLLDAEGGISRQLEACLKHIFAKYCTPRLEPLSASTGESRLLAPPPHAFFSSEALDEWARDTNGAPFSQETKDELIEFLDVTDEGCLTFKGFLQIYQLQTENDEEETWRDLSSHGFDRSLQLVITRREDTDDVAMSS